jgi:hypothetical protein
VANQQLLRDGYSQVSSFHGGKFDFACIVEQKGAHSMLIEGTPV